MKLALAILWMAVGLGVVTEANALGQYSSNSQTTRIVRHIAAAHGVATLSADELLQTSTVVRDCCRNDADFQVLCSSASSCNSGSCGSSCFVMLMHDNYGFSNRDSSNIGVGFFLTLSGRRPDVDERPPRS